MISGSAPKISCGYTKKSDFSRKHIHKNINTDLGSAAGFLPAEMQPFSACCKAVGHACYGGAVLLSRRQSPPSLCWCLHPGAVSARVRARDKAELIGHLQEKNPRAPRPFPPPLPRVSSGPGVSRTPPSVFSTSGKMLNPEPKMVKIGKNSTSSGHPTEVPRL